MQDLTKLERYTIAGTSAFVGLLFYDDLATYLLFTVILGFVLRAIVLYIKNFHGGDFQG